MSWPTVVVAAGCAFANLVGLLCLYGGWRAPKPTPFAFRALVAGLAVPVLGILGTVLGLRSAFGAVATAAPEHKATLLAQGISEAMNATVFGLVACVLPLGVAVALFVRRPSAAAPAQPDGAGT